ncbi:hypothetical protein [Nocardiopsis sp. L17-MgMaSL7]|uniref:hypothetical protein n=1 Tax=Nocardiopsis sp. L17-MgMaSL7 TaxID=1938893 RepID=UPI000D89EF09|nr:hypothetical protein BDW27_101261 [Nocardiopsis sp. L17-MgMaSL7]
MLDIDTRDLLAVAEDALTAPTHLPPALLAEWHSHTLNNRLPLIRERCGSPARRETRNERRGWSTRPSTTTRPPPVTRCRE